MAKWILNFNVEYFQEILNFSNFARISAEYVQWTIEFFEFLRGSVLTIIQWIFEFLEFCEGQCWVRSMEYWISRIFRGSVLSTFNATWIRYKNEMAGGTWGPAIEVSSLIALISSISTGVYCLYRDVLSNCFYEWKTISICQCAFEFYYPLIFIKRGQCYVGMRQIIRLFRDWSTSLYLSICFINNSNSLCVFCAEG